MLYMIELSCVLTTHKPIYTRQAEVLLKFEVCRDITLLPGAVQCLQVQLLVWAAVRVMIKAFYAAAIP